MNNNQIARAYGITHQAVRKWSPERRAAAVALLESGANPHVAEAIGKLASACYVASMRTGKSVYFTPMINANHKGFDVCSWSREAGFDFIVQSACLTIVELIGAIQAVEAL